MLSSILNCVYFVVLYRLIKSFLRFSFCSYDVL
nr:MAG TPA: hypothetical protein [Caudoviricetes sp.]